ncbi:MAG: RsmE family RNA methyltransferase, partial [bacterium]
LILFPWEEEQETSVKAILNEHLNCHKVLCILGPEGGMTREEMLAVKKAGGKVVTLGKRILRAETASVAVLSIVQYALGDLG